MVKENKEILLSLDIDWVKSPRDAKQLLKVLLPILKKTKFKRTVFGQSHRDIAKLIDPIVNPIYCVNVDHHHDIQYHQTCPLECGFLSCNWLGHYMVNNKISGATWIANHDSIFNKYQLEVPYAKRNWSDRKSAVLNDDILDVKLDIEEISNFNYDYFFMCRSLHDSENNPAALMTFDTIEVIYKFLND
tara:strand:+ start:234 stop:800 length:567 start_codon:yes stop_codon:yes gene_type:complete